MTGYKQIKPLGSGGFGIVNKVRRLEDGKIYAKKDLQADASAEATERFVREVRLVQKLDHPNIVKIKRQRISKPPYYFLMSVYNHSLESILMDIVGDEDRIRVIFGAILNAIEYAHKEGVIHRDLKPGNILMNSDHDLVVADFGLGRDCLSDSTRKSVAGVGFGTPLYWSPEQSQDGGSATEKSDIYALGRMLYELYTEPLKSVGHDLTRLRGDIAFIVKKCTQVNPDRRFETITALKEAWNQTTDEISDSSLEQQISEVVAVLSTATSLDEGVIRTLIGLLESNAEEKDLIHEAIMQLPPEVVRQCYASDKEATQGIISAFVDYTVKQGWPFSYTDRIGNKCKAIYQEIEDYHIRGELAFCVASTGVSHSRWKVQTVAIELLQHSKLKGEDDVVIDRLDGGSYSIILWIKEKCSLGKLSPKLRCYIERRSRE